MKTIIFFEDEQAISEIFRVGLERMGYRVLPAATRKQATKISERYQPSGVTSKPASWGHLKTGQFVDHLSRTRISFTVPVAVLASLAL